MRLLSSWSLLALAALGCHAARGEASSPGDELDADTAFPVPEVSVTASFPEDNPFGQIVNGEINSINLLVENNSDRNITILSVGGSFHDAKTDGLIRNATELRYGLRVYDGGRVQIPYQFHSEFKTGDIRLRLWLAYLAENRTFRVPAFDSIAVVAEPEVSMFDYQVISTYLLIAVILGGLGYLAFVTFMPRTRKLRRTAAPATGTPSTSTTTGASVGYEEEWIPAHHFKTQASKTRSRKKAGVLSSGDEQSGGDMSGADTKRRKARK